MAIAYIERYKGIYNGDIASTSTSTGTLAVTGGVGISGNLNVGGSFNVQNLNSNDLTVAGNLTVEGSTTILNTEVLRVEDHNIELGNVETPTDTTANGGGITLKGATDKTLTWSSTTSAWTSNQKFEVTNNTASTSTSTGSLVLAGGAGISGNINAGGTVNRLTGNTASTSTATGTLVVTGGVGVSGTVSASSGAFTTLSSSGATTFTANTASASTNTGTLVVTGGVGVSENINAGGIVTAAGVGITGNLVVQGSTASTSTSTGALVVTGGVGVGGAIYAGSIQNTPIGSTTASTGAFTTLTSNGATTFTANTASTSTATGTLVVTGGVGISGNLNVAQDLKISGSTQSISTSSGALVVTGGVGVGGDFWIGGNVFVDDNKVFEAATVVVTALNVFNADISGNVTIGDTLNVNKINPGVTLALNATSSPKVSIKVPVDFTTNFEADIFTVPTDSMFLIDSMEVLTTEITSPGTPPTVKLGNNNDIEAYYGPTQVTSNSVGARHIIENPQDGVLAGTNFRCRVHIASTAAAHSGFIKVTGELVKLDTQDC